MRFFIAGILFWPFTLTAGEYVPPFETNLIFYVSFDKGVDADRAAGLAKSDGKNVRLTDGVKGQGLACVSTGGVSCAVYQASNNIRADAGTVAFFFRPNWDGTQNVNRVLFSYPGRDNHGYCNNGTCINLLTFHWPGYHDNSQGLMFSQGGNHDLRVDQVNEWRVGEWHHLAFTWDCKWIMGYIDGELKGIKDSGTIVAPGEFFYVGAGQDNYWSADGVIDELRIYGAALSAGEIGILTGRPEYLAPRIMALDLKQNMYFLSKRLMVFKCELGGMIDPARYRLVAEFVSDEAPRDPDSKRSGRGIFAEPCEAKDAIPPCGKPQGFLAKKGDADRETGPAKPLRRWKWLGDLMDKNRKIYGRSEADPVSGVYTLQCLPVPGEGFYTLTDLLHFQKLQC